MNNDIEKKNENAKALSDEEMKKVSGGELPKKDIQFLADQQERPDDLNSISYNGNPQPHKK